MNYEWDEQKRIKNRDCHGVDFTDAARFDWTLAQQWQDCRRIYNEDWFVAIAPVGDRLHVMVFTYRAKKIRIISFRKANAREYDAYVKYQDQKTDED